MSYGRTKNTVKTEKKAVTLTLEVETSLFIDVLVRSNYIGVHVQSIKRCWIKAVNVIAAQRKSCKKKFVT